MRAVHLAMAREAFAAALALLAFLVALHLCTGCAGPPPQNPEQAAAESAYTAALLRCVDQAKTAVEAHDCRRQVNQSWGITEKDLAK